MTDSQLSSSRPYLLRAMHEWMSDNGETPLVVVDAELPGVIVPGEHIKDGRIVLNVGWSATQNLQMGNDEISFQARFGGVPQSVVLPIASLLGIYGRESGQGMVFQDDPVPDPAEQADSPVQAPGQDDDEPDGPRPGGPNLRVIK